MVNHIVGKQQRICLKYWEVENYTRISAYDGREDDLSDILKGKYPDGMSSGEGWLYNITSQSNEDVS